MDYADDVYEKELIQELKTVLNIFILFLTLPIFWALYNAKEAYFKPQTLNTDCNAGFFIINRPMMWSTINPFLVLCLVPIFSKILYPNLADCYIMTKPLTRIIVGMFLTAVAFIIAGGLQLVLQVT